MDPPLKKAHGATLGRHGYRKLKPRPLNPA
jgi:hypothetical protein